MHFLKIKHPFIIILISMARFSPPSLLLVVILAIVFFIFGVLQSLIRCFTKKPTFSSVSHSNRSFPDASNSHIFQQQLQQLFQLHDSGLDQSLVDALPVFYYKELTGLKKPFDCAVCLGEFSNGDKLKLLPDCSHAFHIQCIETWLMSNSTCPLCRTLITNVSFSPNDSTRRWDLSYIDGKKESCSEQKSRITLKKGCEVIHSVRLGKLRGLNEGLEDENKHENAGIISSGNLDARRCYSMGEFQYIFGDNGDSVMKAKARYEANQFSCTKKDGDGKRIMGSGDSLSVSKIWLWSKKGNFSLNSFDDNGQREVV